MKFRDNHYFLLTDFGNGRVRMYEERKNKMGDKLYGKSSDRYLP